MKTMRIGTWVLPVCLCLLFSVTAGAEDKPAESYIYATYHYCDFSQQDRADEIFDQTDKVDYDAAMKDGTISTYGWLAHQTGGMWRRASYFGAGSMQALLDAEQKMIAHSDGATDKVKKLNKEFGGICKQHDDYIWHTIAGNIGAVGRGNAAFSTYYVCDQTRETQADAVVKSMLAPVYDKMVAEGKLKSWGWAEHIVGGKYRRLETMSASDMKSLMEARGALVEALQDDPAGDILTDICGEHTDYMWNIKAQAP
jgi:hypothetical protein